METKTIGFIGGGRITRIFLEGLTNKKAMPVSLKVFEPDTETFKKLQADFPYVTAADSAAGAAQQDLVFIAVHPPLVIETLQAIKNTVSGDTVVISLAPKITLAQMASVLPIKKLVRMIPNATSIINKGYNPVTFGEFSETDKKKVIKLLKKLGKTFETEESKLESYAIISAMLPTYFWFQWQEMETIGSNTGLSVEETRKAVSATLKRALKLYYNSGLTPAEIMDLIPVKPLGEHETEIRTMLNGTLTRLYDKLKPV